MGTEKINVDKHWDDEVEQNSYIHTTLPVSVWIWSVTLQKDSH